MIPLPLGAIVTIAELADNAKSVWTRIKQAIRPRYRSAREMIIASKAEAKRPAPGVIYGVTVNAPEPDGKDHER